MKLTFQCPLIKFYWNTGTPICLDIVNGYFHIAMAELSSCDREQPKIFIIWPFALEVCLPLL